MNVYKDETEIKKIKIKDWRCKNDSLFCILALVIIMMAPRNVQIKSTSWQQSSQQDPLRLHGRIVPEILRRAF